MAQQRWPTEKNIQFIKEYQKNDCLWDPKNSHYKNREAREAAYKNIMKVMEMTSVKEVITKIRILRNTYNNETLKAKKMKVAGISRYVSKIPWLSHFDFIKNIDSSSENTKITIPSTTQEMLTSESNNKEYTAPCTHPQIINKRKIRDPLTRAVNALEKVTANVSNTTNKPNDDEFDLFGKTVAEQLRQLPLETALETEEMILSTIRKQRIREANSKQIVTPDSECFEPMRSVFIDEPESQQNLDEDEGNEYPDESKNNSQMLLKTYKTEMDLDDYKF